MVHQLLQKKRDNDLQIINSFETVADKREREKCNWKKSKKNFKQLLHNNYDIKKALFLGIHRQNIYAQATLRGQYQPNEVGFVAQNQPVFAFWVTFLARIGV